MAFLVGYVTKDEKRELIARGWEIEQAEKYPGLVGDDKGNLCGTPSPTNTSEVVVVFVDASVFDIMNGPDWEKGPA